MTNERIYQEPGGLWYFHIRGNQAVGPYDTYELADDGLSKHVMSCARRRSGKLQWPRSWHPARFLRRSVAGQA